MNILTDTPPLILLVTYREMRNLSQFIKKESNKIMKIKAEIEIKFILYPKPRH